MYCSEYFNVFEYLLSTSHEIEKVSVILAKPTPKKRKTITTETLDLVTNVYEDNNFSRQVPEKKDYVSVSKGVYKQKLCKLQKSLLLGRVIYCFLRKSPKCKYWVVKVLCLETQMECSGWLKNDSLRFRLQRSSKCCVSSRCSGLRLDI